MHSGGVGGTKCIFVPGDLDMTLTFELGQDFCTMQSPVTTRGDLLSGKTDNQTAIEGPQSPLNY